MERKGAISADRGGYPRYMTLGRMYVTSDKLPTIFRGYYDYLLFATEITQLPSVQFGDPPMRSISCLLSNQRAPLPRGSGHLYVVEQCAATACRGRGAYHKPFVAQRRHEWLVVRLACGCRHTCASPVAVWQCADGAHSMKIRKIPRRAPPELIYLADQALHATGLPLREPPF